MSLVRRKIQLSFRLGKGSFGESGYDTLTVSGLRTRVSITDAGGPTLGQARVRVFGLSLQHMAQLAQIMKMPNGEIQLRFNEITIIAGDDDRGMSQIFQGQITSAPIDLGGQPDAIIDFSAFAGGFEAVRSIAPTSYPAGTAVADIMANYARQAGYAFENHGVNTVISKPYFPGSLGDQIRSCAEQADCEVKITNGTLIIVPKGQPRNMTDVPLVSPATGMVDYPIGWNQGISVRSIYNPSLLILGQVQVKSVIPFANGFYTIYNVAHDLESETPNGDWFTAFNGFPLVN